MSLGKREELLTSGEIQVGCAVGLCGWAVLLVYCHVNP